MFQAKSPKLALFVHHKRKLMSGRTKSQEGCQEGRVDALQHRTVYVSGEIAKIGIVCASQDRAAWDEGSLCQEGVPH